MRVRAQSQTCCVVALLLAVVAVLFGALSAMAGDHVIVVDTSASMKGVISRADRRIRLPTVQEELSKYLKKLPAGSRVYLIAFNTGIVSEKELVLKTDADLQMALNWVAGLSKVRYGDTYLWSALRAALRIATHYANQSADQPVSVLVLTDGQDNEPDGPSLEQVLAEFPLKIQRNEIQAGLVLLGNLDIRGVGKAKELGIDVIVNSDWSQIFPPVIRWEPNPPQVGQQVRFTDISEFAYESYHWSADGRAIGNQQTIDHAFAKEGSHRVMLDVIDAKGRSTRSTVTVLVSQTDLSCEIVISASEVEPGQEVQLFSRLTGSPVRYSWRVNGQEVGTNAHHAIRFDKEGKHEVQLEVHDATTKAVSVNKVVHVREPKAQMAFKCPVEVRSGQTLTFRNESVGRLESFRWMFGDGKESADRNPTHTYQHDGADPKVFRVILQGRTMTGRMFESSPVAVRVMPGQPAKPPPPPQAAFRVVGEPPHKVGLNIQIMNLSTGLIDSYHWNLGEEMTSVEQSPEFTPAGAGEKTLRLIVTGPGGSSTNEQTITVVQRHIPPGITRIKFLPHKPRLKEDEPAVVRFQAAITGEYESVIWSFGDGTKSGRLRPTHAYSKVGEYTVQVVARNSAKQEAIASVQIWVLPPPPWWHQIPLFTGIAFAVWALIVVPFFLKPAMVPHKTAVLQSSVTYNLRQLALRKRYRWLWPPNAVTIGAKQNDDIRLNTADGTSATVAVIKRQFASGRYRLIPRQADMVKILGKYLVSVAPGEGRSLRDGDQICVGDETFLWACPSKEQPWKLKILARKAHQLLSW